MDADSERHPSLNERIDPAIRIAPYAPERVGDYELEADAIRRVLGNHVVSVDHVGSTAVPGLASKPIIDIQVCVKAMEPRDTYVRPLQELGYLFAPDPDSPDFHFFGKPAGRPRRFHLHVCQTGSLHEQRHLAVRDYLRAHPAEAERYADRKRELVAQHPEDRLAYIKGKEPYMRDIEQRALSNGAVMPGHELTR